MNEKMMHSLNQLWNQKSYKNSKLLLTKIVIKLAK